jgi:hypothetical protein
MVFHQHETGFHRFGQQFLGSGVTCQSNLLSSLRSENLVRPLLEELEGTVAFALFIARSEVRRGKLW